MESERPAGEPSALGEPARPASEPNLRRRVHPGVAAGLLIVLVVGAGGVVVFHIGRAPHLATRRDSPRAAHDRCPANDRRAERGAAPAPLEVVGTSPAPGATTSASRMTSSSSSPRRSPQRRRSHAFSERAGQLDARGIAALVFRPNGYFAPLSRLLLIVPAGPPGPRGRLGIARDAVHGVVHRPARRCCDSSSSSRSLTTFPSDSPALWGRPNANCVSTGCPPAPCPLRTRRRARPRRRQRRHRSRASRPSPTQSLPVPRSQALSRGAIRTSPPRSPRTGSPALTPC